MPDVIDGPMKRRHPLRVAIVVAGYVAAYAAGVLAVRWHDRALNPADQMAMSGMLAFGDGVLFLAAAAPFAIIATVALFSLFRFTPRFWRVYTAGSLLLSMTGVVEGLVLNLPARGQIGPFQMLQELSPLRVLAAPVFLLVYAPGLLPSASRYRRVALTACLLELCTMASFALFLLIRAR